jgi:hypothetical protein
MSSTFSPSLRIELIGDGDQSGIWGQTTNSNLGTIVEQAITGVVSITMLDANYTMTNFNGVADEARNAVLVLTGTLTAQRNLIAPLVEKTYSIKNSTTGGLGVQIVGSSGTGVVIPNGQTIPVYCDGTNFYALVTGTATNFSIAGNLAVSGTTALSGALTGTSGAFSGAISGTTITGTNHIGPGTGLTGTASGLSIGGNAATATTATTATTANALNTANAYQGTTFTATTQFSGPGTGLTGTASSLTVGSATNAGNSSTTSQTNFSNLLISGNQVLSAANYNSYAPTLGGSGASGTWGINVTGSSASCTGNAATATTAATANALNSGLGYSVASLTASGNVTAYSDERLKTDVQTFSNALATVQALRGVSYIKDGQAQVGVIAQEVQKVLPQVVQDNPNSYLSVAYGNIVGVLIEAVKELKAEVEELKRGK